MERSAAIVVPLEFERAALVRAGLDRRADVTCTGPGAAAGAWCTSQPPGGGRLVILAGLAGSLDERFGPGTAHLVGAVVDADGRRFVPPIGGGDSAPVVLAAPAVLTTPAAKREWARRSAAHLADLESAAFAAAASARGWRWAIVRGVSDGLDDRLPAAAAAWVDGQGRTRPAKVLTSLLRGPGEVACTIRLGRSSRRAMHAVVEIVVRTMAEHGG